MLHNTGQFGDGQEHVANVSEVPKSWPRAALKRVRGLSPLFVCTVLMPMVMAVLYFGFLASDVYVSESRFVVRSPDKPASSGIGILLKSAGFTNAGDEVYAAKDYVVSRDALSALNRSDAFRKASSQNSIFYFDRFGTLFSGSTFEDLYKYFQSRVHVDHVASSSITTLTVRAYTARDAQRFNEQLLEMAEATVNRLNERGRKDLIRFAETEVEDAKRAARMAALALSAYRNQEGVVDPEKQAAVQLQMISKLQDELIAARTQLVALRQFTPRNPQIEVLQSRIRELGREVDMQLGKVAGDRRSLAATAAQYQRLALESQFADKQLAASMASLEDARNEARRKQAYVERIVEPNLPDDALEPRRLRGLISTLLFSLIVWGVLQMLFAAIREHKQ
ncbi:hypothetical protein [Sphingobium sp. CFD-2]|uniref:hypothetical protein n=1 Tax=Sphingobium sp. CFD-2 TaxID=2878542 RepID=UPI00214C3FC7|nr:hypothetical protein [Sphingobium sp. CFD-2]